MKKILSKEFVIGACVIIALAILFFGIEYLKGVSIFKPSNYYYAVYSDVKGLTTSSPINVNGVKVGQVNEVEVLYNRPGHVLVEFSIDKELKLPVNSKAVIDTDLLGTASIRLDLAQGQSYYQPGDTVPGTIATGMMDMLSGAGDIVPKINTLVDNLNTLTGNPSIGQTLDNLAAFSGGLQGLLNNVDKSVTTINGAAGKINPLLDDLASITSNIDSLSLNLHALSESLNNAPIEQTLQNANEISENINNLTAKIDKALDDPNSNLGQLLNGSQLYDNLVKTSADIDSLIVDLKRNPKRYISIKLL